ncbi:conserved hypothetical protein [Ricinus communis]|uniref:Nutrient reservoir n=2 Tax=Ricinus communis TaxID=3988 RepID=B9SJ46_RICCO|nr:conserved hypothetical protein [Ricinus communis]
MTKSDDTCPYPCYPPPTGTGGPTVITPSTPTSQTGLYPPPAGNSYPSPTGNNFPYYPPPTGNNFVYGPPPDPILPYFPFYYRKPPHQTDVSSAVTSPRSSLLIVTTIVIGFTFL